MKKLLLILIEQIKKEFDREASLKLLKDLMDAKGGKLANEERKVLRKAIEELEQGE